MIISSNSCSKKEEDEAGQMEDERWREERKREEKFVLRVADRLPPYYKGDSALDPLDLTSYVS